MKYLVMTAGVAILMAAPIYTVTARMADAPPALQHATAKANRLHPRTYAKVVNTTPASLPEIDPERFNPGDETQGYRMTGPQFQKFILLGYKLHYGWNQ